MMSSATPGWSFGIVIFGPVEQENHVGVLLDGARLAQVGHPGSPVFAALHGAVELRKSDHGNVELAGKGLEPPADLGDLFLPAVARVLANQ